MMLLYRTIHGTRSPVYLQLSSSLNHYNKIGFSPLFWAKGLVRLPVCSAGLYHTCCIATCYQVHVYGSSPITRLCVLG